MPHVSDRVFRIQAPFDGNAVNLYLVRGAKLALIDSGAGDSPQVAVEPALRSAGVDRELAETAFREVVFELGFQWDRRTIVPVVAARAISAHLKAHGWHA